MRAGCRGAERGFVLVAVLFVATLLLGSAVSFALFARNEVRRSRSEEFALEARSLAVIAFDNVSEWIALDKNDFDSAREPLYSPSIPIMLSFGEWRVFVRIVPQGGPKQTAKIEAECAHVQHGQGVRHRKTSHRQANTPLLRLVLRNPSPQNCQDLGHRALDVRRQHRVPQLSGTRQVSQTAQVGDVDLYPRHAPTESTTPARVWYCIPRSPVRSP